MSLWVSSVAFLVWVDSAKSGWSRMVSSRLTQASSHSGLGLTKSNKNRQAPLHKDFSLAKVNHVAKHDNSVGSSYPRHGY